MEEKKGTGRRDEKIGIKLNFDVFEQMKGEGIRCQKKLELIRKCIVGNRKLVTL